MLFFPIEHQLHGQLRLLRKLRADEALDIRSELAAEAAAHVLRDHADVCLRNLETVGEPDPALMGALRRYPRRQLVAVPLADAAVRLEADVRDHMRGVRRVDEVLGVREPS